MEKLITVFFMLFLSYSFNPLKPLFQGEMAEESLKTNQIHIGQDSLHYSFENGEEAVFMKLDKQLAN